jgi:hypothetical protein
MTREAVNGLCERCITIKEAVVNMKGGIIQNSLT